MAKATADLEDIRARAGSKGCAAPQPDVVGAATSNDPNGGGTVSPSWLYRTGILQRVIAVHWLP